MRSVTQSLATAIEASERVIKHNVTVDWDNDGVQDIDDVTHKVGQVSVDQSLESALPEQVRVVPGAAVAQLTATLERGNTVRYDVAASFKTAVTGQSDSSVTITVPAPTGLQPGDVVLVAVFYPNRIGATIGLPNSTNVDWTSLAWSSDGTDSPEEPNGVEGHLLTRRAVVGEPASYAFTFGQEALPYVGAAVRVGDAGIMGITDYTFTGPDDGSATYTTVTGLPARASLPGSTVVSFFALQSPTVTGVSWSPLDGDVERVDVGTSSPPVSGLGNVRVAVMTADNVSPGVYLKRAQVNGSTSVSATLQFTVVLAPKLAGDESQHAAWTFSELNPRGPYAGKQRFGRRTRWGVQFAGESGFEEVPVFTGLSISAGAASRARTAGITALDDRELMRNTAYVLSGIVAESPVVLDGINHLPLYPGLEATWFVSFLMAHVLVSNADVPTSPADLGVDVGVGYFASPPPRPGSFVTWIPCHGSMHAFKGAAFWAYTRTSVGLVRRVRFVRGPYVAATEPAPVGGRIHAGYSPAGIGSIFNTTGQLSGRFEFWARLTVTGGTVQITGQDDLWTPTRTAQALITAAGAMQLKLDSSVASRTVNGPTVPTDGGWHFYGVHFDSVAGSATFRVDDASTVVAFTPMTTTATTFDPGASIVDIRDGAQVAEIMLHGGFPSEFFGAHGGPVTAADPWVIENFTPSAFIDKSDNTMDACPVIGDAEDVWSVLSAIAEAEFAAVYFDADGHPHFRNTRSDVSTAGQTVVRSLTARSALKDLAYESNVAQVVNVVSVPYAPVVAYVNQLAYSAPGAIFVPPKTELEVSAQLTGPVLALFPATYDANTLANGTGTDVTATLSVALGSTKFGVKAFIDNPNDFAVWMVDTSGQPSLKLFATWVGPDQTPSAPVTLQDDASIRRHRQQPLTVNTSVWRQRQDVAGTLATKLLSDLRSPHPTITHVPIVGDPRLELGDRVRLVDVNGLGVDGTYRITGLVNEASSRGGYEQDLTVRDSNDVARWGINYWDDGSVWGVVS